MLDNVFGGFDRKHEYDGRTDGRTDTPQPRNTALSIYAHCIYASRGKNTAELNASVKIQDEIM